MDLMPTEKWNHVNGLDNPADCASRGLFPSELLTHSLWWNGPEWLRKSFVDWPQQSPAPLCCLPEEEKETALLIINTQTVPLIAFNRYSSFNTLKRVTTWIFHFIHNCRLKMQRRIVFPLTVEELLKAERYWMRIMQEWNFKDELTTLNKKQPLEKSSRLLTLHPFLDSAGLIRVGGRQRLSRSSYESLHPIVLYG